ncbi:alpha/beta hydrolase [Devosia pacifica]|nr:alpha/beta hydrolase [Devosia pacifica]
MAISPLHIFNRLVPKHPASHQVAKGISFEPASRLKLDLYAPKGPVTLPSILFLYGGSWNDGERGNYRFAGRALASLGALVAVADYRLQPEAEYPVFLEDCTAAYGWLAENAEAHGGSKRLVLAGHSAGAYNAAMVAMDRRYLQHHGLREQLAGVVGLCGPYDFFPFDGEISMRTFGAVPDPESTQPINHVSAGLPPFWLGAGLDDPLVSPQNSRTLASALRALDIDVTHREYEGMAHAEPLLALSWPLNRWRPVLADIGKFLKSLDSGHSAPKNTQKAA